MFAMDEVREFTGLFSKPTRFSNCRIRRGLVIAVALFLALGAGRQVAQAAEGIPHATVTPHPSEPPHATMTPHPSEPPHPSMTPHPSEPPHATMTPHPSEPPHPSMTPHPSEPPHPSMTPHPSEPPHPSMTPHPSEPPHPSMTPHPSEPPHPSMTPHPSAPPHHTPTPHPSEPPHATPTATPRVAIQPLNISTRLHVDAGENVAIGGFMITGASPKRVAIRGMGPSLQGSMSGALSDPTLQLHAPDNSFIANNDNWRDNPAWAAELEAVGLAPGFNFESAIVATLPPGAYTAIMSGKNESTGMGLVEVYDLNAAGDGRLTNISTRGLVRTGSQVVIGGFILGGDTGQATVLLRAIGPSLNGFGIANALANPTLELRDSNGLLLQSNDNWKDTQQAAIEATGLAPQNDPEAAILATLLPGSYTAIAAGKDGTMGVGLIEVYNLSVPQ